MEPFDSIEKLITEHGSAVILREHIALLKSQMSAKDTEIQQKDVAIQNLNILLKQKDVQINNLKKAENNKTVSDEICPYCKQQKGKLIEITPSEDLEEFIKIHHYKCESCGKKYEKTQIPKF